VTLAEPTMLIGFALLYAQTAQQRPSANDSLILSR